MELKDFVKKVLSDLVLGVEEARSGSVRDMKLYDKDSKTVEFDIAVTVEDIDKKSGKEGIRVLQFAEASGDVMQEVKNSTVSRIKFGVFVDVLTKDEGEKRRKIVADIEQRSSRRSTGWMAT